MVGCPWRGTSGGRLVRFYERGCRLRAGRTRNMPLHHRYTKGAPGGMRVLHVCALAITQGTHTSMHLHIKERDAIRRLQAQRVRREQAHRMMSRHVAMGSQSDSYIHKCGDADADGDATTLTYVSPSLALFHLRKLSLPPPLHRSISRLIYMAILLDSPHNCSFKLVYALQSTDSLNCQLRSSPIVGQRTPFFVETHEYLRA